MWLKCGQLFGKTVLFQDKTIAINNYEKFILKDVPNICRLWVASSIFGTYVLVAILFPGSVDAYMG